MTIQRNVVAETSHYKIEQIEKLAIIKFKPESPIEELYKLENIGQYFSVDLDKLVGKEITTRLFLFTDNIFSEERFDEFIKTIKNPYGFNNTSGTFWFNEKNIAQRKYDIILKENGKYKTLSQDKL